MDIKDIVKKSAFGRLSSENAAKFLIRWVCEVLENENFTSEQIMKFGAGMATEVLKHTIEMAKACKKKGGEKDVNYNGQD